MPRFAGRQRPRLLRFVARVAAFEGGKMNGQQLVWLAEAEEIATEVEVAEEFQFYGFYQLCEEVGAFYAWGVALEWEAAQYAESHPSVGRSGSHTLADDVIFQEVSNA
jgi:hypothetical protein